MANQPRGGSVVAVCVGALAGASIGFYYMEQERRRVQARLEETLKERMADLETKRAVHTAKTAADHDAETE